MLLSCAAWAEAPTDASGDTPAAGIEEAIRDLGDDDFGVRQRATHSLWQAGESAEPALREAMQSTDPEVASRARWILDRLRFGLLPDTPHQLVGLIEQFRLGNEGVRRTVIKRLTESGHVELATRLIRTDPDIESRERLTSWMVGEIGKSARQLIVDGNFGNRGGIRKLLEVATQSDSGCRDFAAYLLVQGELDVEIAQRMKRLKQQPDEGEARLLGYLLRARGDLPGALGMFDEQANDARLTRGVLAELGDWKALAERWDELLPPANNPIDEEASGGDEALERLGMAATFHQLAGNEAQFSVARDQLREAASQDARDSWYAIKALLIAGQIDEAIELFSEHGHAQTTFDLLVAQMRFDEAFRAAGMDGPRSPFDLKPRGDESGEEFDDDALGTDGEENTQQARATQVRFSLGLSVAQVLHRLGWTTEAEELFDRLAAATTDNPKLQLRAVCRAEREAELDASAFQRAAGAMDEESAAAYLAVLFPKQAPEAIRWWNYLTGGQSETDPTDRLARIRGIVERSWARDELIAAADEAEKYVPADSPEDHAEWLIAIGQLRLDANDTGGAKRCFEKATKANRSAETLVRLADFHWNRRQWKAAADAYETAIALAAEQPPESYAHLLYLQGYASTKAGDEGQGNCLMAAARQLPLGNARVRHALAETLGQRDLAKEAVHQWNVILQTGEFNEWALNDAAKQLGNTLSGKDGLRAANYWQRLLISCAKRNANLVKADGYLKLIQLIHRLRARGLLENGDSDQAVREIWLAHTAMPGDVPLVCDLIPQLDAAGLRAEADRLFEATYAHLLLAGKNHPHAASLLNNAAWMAATCNRRLDDAQSLAQRATELSPDNPVYLDTLAEAYFRRGDREKAAGLARRCAELDPKPEHYRQQLARFTEPE